jgi:hypothetical protein
MKECREHLIKVGFNRSPRKIFNEIEVVAARMLRDGWTLYDSCFEDGLAYIHLLFERNIVKTNNMPETSRERSIHEI